MTEQSAIPLLDHDLAEDELAWMQSIYTAFSNTLAGRRGQIMFSSSADCGQTWARPKDISTVADPDINDDGLTRTLAARPEPPWPRRRRRLPAESGAA